MRLFRRLWRDKRGFIATTDVILLATIVVLGSIVGLVTLRNQVVQEFGDMSVAVGNLNQGYRYNESYGKEYVGGSWIQDNDKWVAGSFYTDEADYGDDGDPDEEEPAGINVAAAAATGESGTVSPTP